MLQFLINLGEAFAWAGGVLGFFGFAAYVLHRLFTAHFSLLDLLEPLFRLVAYLVVPSTVMAYFFDLLGQRLPVIPLIPDLRMYLGWLGVAVGTFLGLKIYRWFD